MVRLPRHGIHRRQPVRHVQHVHAGDAWQRAVVFRFPLATLAAGTSLGYRCWATTNNGSIRLTRGAAATMYMGSHNSAAQIRVLQWPDSATGMSWNDVNVRSWAAGAYSAPGPGGVNWLGRLDPRITGAWVGAATIGFMWSANRDASHPLPYVRVVRLKESTKALIDEPDIWSRTSAWAYPAAAANAEGVVGFSAFYGGGTRHPGHVVGVKTATGWDTRSPRPVRTARPTRPGATISPVCATMAMARNGSPRAIRCKAAPRAATSSRATCASARESRAQERTTLWACPPTPRPAARASAAI